MPGGLVGQGAEFSRSSCVLVKLTARQPKRVSISLLSLSKTLPPLPSPPSACLAWCPDLLKLTLNQKYLLSPPPSPKHFPLAQQRSFHHSGWHWIIFLPQHIPAKEEDKGGVVSALWLYHYRAADMYTVYWAQPVISILYLMMAKYKCAFVGSDQLDRLCASAAELHWGMLSQSAPNLRSTLSYKKPFSYLLYHYPPWHLLWHALPELSDTPKALLAVQINLSKRHGCVIHSKSPAPIIAPTCQTQALLVLSVDLTSSRFLTPTKMFHGWETT